ncbi:11646_t:CDS:1, partial [Racocetra persica]
MLQNLYHVSKTSMLQCLNLRTSRYMINIFNRDYATQRQLEPPKEIQRNLVQKLDTRIDMPQVARDLQKSNPIEIEGEGLTIENVIQVARFRREARLTTNNAIREKVTTSNIYINNAIAEGKTIYGVNTNFGGMAKKHLSIEELTLLQKNLIWGHKCSIGKQLPVEHVRA